MRTALVLIAASCLLGSACGADRSPGGSASYRIATASVRSDSMDLALAVGTLQGKVNVDGTACFWLGTSSRGQALSWPYCYSAKDHPLAVYDEAGNRVAMVGQSVKLTGGLMADTVRSITGCSGFAEFFGVGKVDSAT